MQFINLHTHQFTNNQQFLEIVNQYPLEFNVDVPNYSIGIHPWKINLNNLEQELQIISEKLTTENCIALGECGLDKRIETPLKTQIDVFEKQLEIIKNYNKPIILHLVAAFDELILIKKQSKLANNFIIHGFSKNAQVANQLINEGFFLSFGKHLIQNHALETVFKNLPNEKIFLETDTLVNNLEEIYKFAANCKKISVDEMKKIVWNNYKTVFNQ